MFRSVTYDLKHLTRLELVKDRISRARGRVVDGRKLVRARPELGSHIAEQRLLIRR
jgi:hypothetical protein